MIQDPAEPASEPLISAAEFDAATRAEFGVSITQIAEFVQALIEIGAEQQGPTKHLPESRVRELLESKLGWAEVELDAAFHLLSLGPRPTFLDPPPGVRATGSPSVGV